MTESVTEITLPFLQRERTRHGKVVYYVRKDDGPRTRVRGEPGSDEFMANYRDALKEAPMPDEAEKPPARGTFGWLVALYKDSAEFASKAPATQAHRRRSLDALCREHKNTALHKFTPAAIAKGMDKRRGKPEAANHFVKVMRALFKWAKSRGHVSTNPAKTIELVRTGSTGHHTWSVEEVYQYQAKWALGTKERLALDLLLYTGLRTCDIVKAGRQHIRNGAFSFTTKKTGTTITVTVGRELRESLDAYAGKHMTFLVTEWGQPFSVKGFGQWFVRKARAAGCIGTAHGMRKAGATIMAENGASEHELMAVFGWKDIRQAAHYTREANRKKTGMSGSAKIKLETPAPHPVNSNVPAPEKSDDKTVS